MSAFHEQIVADLHECVDWAEGGPDADNGAVLRIARVNGRYVAAVRRPHAGREVWQPGESVADALANLAERVVEIDAAERSRREAA